MNKFQTLRSRLIPLPENDIDTDQIIPARYLKVTDKQGLADGLFAEWRYTSSGSLDPEFPLNQGIYQGMSILLSGDNFGCGSSREHAPWALVQWGIRAVISTSFADIFKNNALKNGLLPIEVPSSVHKKLSLMVLEDPLAEVVIDLSSQSVILPDGIKVKFSIDPFNKRCLIEGIDSLGYLRQFEKEISAYENLKNHDGYPGINTLI
jgi:3-isopropylmalate/(R)-2-methylmalate dehydratase small subunit